MKEKIIIAGSGGQGVLTLGVFLAKVGFYENKNVAWLPSYGAEKRGGFSFCNVVISDDEIYSPVVETPDTLFVFDQRALDQYSSKITENTLVIANSSLLINTEKKNKNFYLIPASKIAKEIDFIQAMNIVIFGAFLKLKPLFKKESVLNVMKEMLKGRKEEIYNKNFIALEKGMEFIK
jgi:2-oxoglutarate ferredoxin oxidoreductase subunit gamma